MAKRYWGALTRPGAEWLAQSGLSSASFKIFFFLVSQLNDENLITQPRYALFKALRNDTGISKATFYKAFDTLIEKKILYKYKNGYMVNPNIFYMGGKKNARLLELDFLQKIIGLDAELLEEPAKVREKVKGPIVPELFSEN